MHQRALGHLVAAELRLRLPQHCGVDHDDRAAGFSASRRARRRTAWTAAAVRTRWSPASAAGRRGSSVVSGSIGGIANALLIRQSTRPYSAERCVDERLAGVLVVDVGGYDERPAAVGRGPPRPSRRAASACARRAPGRRPASRPPHPARAPARARPRRARPPCPAAAGGDRSVLTRVASPVGRAAESSLCRGLTRSSFGRCRPGGRRCGRCTRPRRSGSPRGAATGTAARRTAPPRPSVRRPR